MRSAAPLGSGEQEDAGATTRGPVWVPVKVDDDVVTARQQGRRLAHRCGLSPTDTTLLITAISEVTRNILAYADHGEIVIDLVRSGGRQGVEVTAHDDGPGISDVEQAMTDGYSTGSGLGLGLPGAGRLVDELDLHTERGAGTTVTLRKWR